MFDQLKQGWLRGWRTIPTEGKIEYAVLVLGILVVVGMSAYGLLLMLPRFAGL